VFILNIDKTKSIIMKKNIDGLWSYHNDHKDAVNEIHARPALKISQFHEVFQLAFSCHQDDIALLFSRPGMENSSTGPRHTIGKIGTVQVKMEQHTEFISCTFSGERYQLKRVHDRFFEKIDIKIFSSCRITPIKKSINEPIIDENQVFGGTILGKIKVRSSLKTDYKGVVEYFLYTDKMDHFELGRRTQRLLDVEVYRIMALLGLPLARRLNLELTKIESKLKELTDDLEKNTNPDTSEKEIFNELSSLSEKISHQRVNSRYRFAASNAYFTIVEARLKALNETPDSQLQTISGFLLSRLEPARLTISSAQTRQKNLIDDISRGLTLLRTRIELQNNETNQVLLKSLNEQNKQQLIISQAVEGLSTIAISYYAIGLLTYLFKALEKYNLLLFSFSITVAISIPIVVLIVWYSAHRVRVKITANT